MSPLLSEASDAHSIVLMNNHDELPKLAEWVNNLAEELGIPFQVSFRLDLVLAEATTNVMDYAYEGGEHEIGVSLQKDGDTVNVELVDTGKHFDPTQVPEAEQPDSLSEAQIGGLGVHLIRNMMDEFSYRREGDKNVLAMSVTDSGEDDS